MSKEQPNNPLHGITLRKMVEDLVEHFGFEELGRRVKIRAFQHEPSIQSALKFLRRTPWARAEVEDLYLKNLARTSLTIPSAVHSRGKQAPNSADLFVSEHIRPAQRSDAATLARLINEAGEGLPFYFWTQGTGERDPWDYGAERAARDDGDFSWRNAHVVEESGSVVALLLGFRVEPADLDLPSIPEIVRPLAELEQLAVGSWYVNALAVQPRYRNRGYGSRLLALSHALAMQKGCQQLSLQNFTNNPRARQLYERQGFREVARRPMPSIDQLPHFGDSILHMRDVDAAVAARFRDVLGC